MKRLVIGVFAVFGAATAAALAFVVGTNAVRERQRHCWCPEDCWCKTALGRHLRWWVPGRYHKMRVIPPE
jgi:hypothetical protein